MSSSHIKAAPLPSFKRYRSLFLDGEKASVTRVLQYELISRESFSGKLLDFGGGDNAKYKPIIKCGDYESVNIDPGMEPTWVTKVGEDLPCPMNHYDNVISLNTFEHIYDVRPIIKSLYGVLKSGGKFTCALPFLYPVHAHPDDFFRPTASWWLKTLTDSGFKDIKITPILWGPFSTGIICSGLPGPFKRFRVHLNLLLDLIYIKLRFEKGQSHFTGKAGEQLNNHALGYFIQAVK